MESKILTGELMRRALSQGLVIPAFNIPYLPMMEPVICALRDTHTVGLIAVARLEWEKFGSQSLEAVQAEYARLGGATVTRLHLDHVPVVDEDGCRVDFMDILRRALKVGYESVMVDGSRLSLKENIAATAQAAELAHEFDVPIEAELGAVLGHESGPLPPYEELFASGQGFTDPAEAREFVQRTGADWLSVAVGNIHGAISGVARHQRKPAARISLPRLGELRDVTGIPLVLHGGSGIPAETMRQAFASGIAKINIGTDIRQAYEAGIKTSPFRAQLAVYQAVRVLVEKELCVAGSGNRLMACSS